MAKKQREYQQSVEKCKKLQSEELTEQQHRLEMVKYNTSFIVCRPSWENQFFLYSIKLCSSEIK